MAVSKNPLKYIKVLWDGIFIPTTVRYLQKTVKHNQGTHTSS